MRRLILLAVCLLLCGVALWGQAVTVYPTSFPDGAVGSAYGETLVPSGGYGGGTYTFSLASGTLPPGLVVSGLNGYGVYGFVLGTPTAVGTFTFTVQVTSTDASSDTIVGTQLYTVTIYPSLAIVPASPSSGILGVPYSQTFTVSGGAGPSTYSWSLVSGTLPPGLVSPSFANVPAGASMVISGTPTASGTFPFSVQLGVAGPPLTGVSATQGFNIAIAPTAPAITGSLGNGAAGGPYSATLGATGGFGAGTYAFSLASGALPPGLTLSAGGTLSGTPTALGTFTFTAQVASTLTANGVTYPSLTATQSYTVTIQAEPSPVIAPTSFPNGIVGTAYSQTLAASLGYGAGTYTFSLASGTAPSGLTLSAGGTLSGTPTAAGTFTFTAQVVSNIVIDGVTLPTLTGTQGYTIVIYPAPAITGAPESTGIVGVAFSQAFAATGGGTSTWSTGGTLPPGLSFSSNANTGLLSGTPTAAGTFPFSVQAYVNVPTVGLVSVSAGFTTAIAPAPPAITGSMGNGTISVPYSATLGATGGFGAGTYAFSLASGTAPPGLTLSAGGTLSGTPTALGTFTFTAQVASTLTANGVTYPSLTATQSYTVTIQAEPDPVIAPTSFPNGILGTAYSQTLTASLGYGAGTYTFSLASGALPSGTTLSAGGTLSGTPTAAGTFTFTAQCTSNLTVNGVTLPPVTGTQSFTVVVYPVPAITPQTMSSGSVGVPYSQTFAATGGAGPSTYTWSLAAGTLPPGLTLSAAGVLSGTPTTAGTFSIYVQVSSQIPTVGAQVASQWFTVVIGATSSLTITGSLSGGTVGVPYSATLTGSGGYSTGAYTFALASGTLPAGLTLSAGGTLSGTPTAAGTSTFTVQVTSAAASLPPLTATQSYTVVVYPVLAITPPTANSGSVGAAYSQTLTATGGAGPSTYTWSLASGTLPPGLTLSAAGVLSGTPTTAGTFSFTVQVSSQVPTIGAQTASQAYSVVIATVPSLSIAGILSGGTVGVPYSGTLTGVGGYSTGAYTFALASGALPAGLTLSAGGTLSGTPTAAGTSTFTVQVTSAAASLPPLTATQSYTVVIYPVLAITLATASSGSVGVVYSQVFTSTGGGGTSTYTWSVTAGAPPPGLTFSAAGVLSGTPTTAGTFSFTVQVSSQVPTIGVQTASQAFSIVIAALSSLTITGTLGSATAGIPYSATLGATGGYGTGTYTFSLVAGALPTGVTLSAGGTLSGTPTGAGTSTFTVQVTSTLTTAVASLLPLTATQSFTVVVSATSLTITGSPGSGTVGVPYAATFTGSGGYGTGTYTFSLASGTLPANITLSTGGILSGAPTAVGTFTFTVEVTSTQANQPLTATQSFTITVGVAPAPLMTITGLPATPAAATQFGLGVSAGSTYPIAIQGTITLTFAPDSGPDDPNVQFTAGGRTTTFQMPAGSTLAQFPGSAPGVQTGTVAGTITLTLTLTAAGVDITPTPAPTQVLTIAKSAPAITSATVTPTTGGFNLVVVGYSTTRDMVSAAITFTPTSGVTLASNSTTVSLSQVFTAWYQSSTSAPFGSMFSLEIPFIIQNGTNPLASISVALTNSQGSSATTTAAF